MVEGERGGTHGRPAETQQVEGLASGEDGGAVLLQERRGAERHDAVAMAPVGVVYSGGGRPRLDVGHRSVNNQSHQLSQSAHLVW